MALSGFILKNREEYLVESTLEDIKIAVRNANLHMYSGNIEYEDGKFSYVVLGILDDIAFDLDEEDIGDEDIDQGQKFNFYVEAIDMKYVNDKTFKWVLEGSKLYQVAYVEKIRNNKEIIFKFIHEYLKLNPKDYFWVEDDWVYTLEDMDRLSKLPFDENWCYKDPNKIKNK